MPTEKELTGLLSWIREFLVEGLSIRASQKAVNIYIYDADFKDVARLVEKRNYRLACVCGTTEGTVRSVAIKRVKMRGFEVISNVFGKVVPSEDHLRLRKEVESNI